MYIVLVLLFAFTGEVNQDELPHADSEETREQKEQDRRNAYWKARARENRSDRLNQRLLGANAGHNRQNVSTNAGGVETGSMNIDIGLPAPAPRIVRAPVVFDIPWAIAWDVFLQPRHSIKDWLLSLLVLIVIFYMATNRLSKLNGSHATLRQTPFRRLGAAAIYVLIMIVCLVAFHRCVFSGINQAFFAGFATGVSLPLLYLGDCLAGRGALLEQTQVAQLQRHALDESTMHSSSA